jgi:lipopolysaccharide/colanic/teichoic acid biosynthesis glycosyltransferase
MTDTITKIKPQLTSYHLSFSRQLDRLLKRASDLCAAFSGLILLSPFFILIAVLIKRESPGPVFYRGPRAGQNGKTFQILKFRTMYERPESYQGARVTAAGDNRITPLGQWLRDSKLNELPQLWNVLVGEMSLVGPRPEDPDIVKTWPLDVRAEILSVRPGITSPASIIYRDEEKLLKSANVMDAYLKDVLPDKLRLDRLYVRNRSFLSDLDVIFYTLIALLPSLRKTPIPTELLYNGWLSRFTKRYFSWLMLDVLVAFGALALAGLLWRMSSPLDLGIDLAIAVAGLIALTFSLVNSFLGLGRVSWRHAPAAYALDLAFSSGISTLLLTTLDWRWQNGPFLPLGMILVSGLLAFLGFVSVRYRERLLTGLATRWLWRREAVSAIGERVLIVGAGECGLLASWLLHHSNLSSAFSIIGMVDDNPTKQGLTIDGHRVFGLTRRIPELVEQYDIGVILFAIEKIQPADQERILDMCRHTQARVVLIPDLLSIFRQRLSRQSADLPVDEKRITSSS